MIKDLVVNLSVGTEDDCARDYAISLARQFNAHLAGVAFAYEPITPAILAEGAPPDWFDELMQDAENSARAAVDKFNAATQGSGVLTEARWLTTTIAGTGDMFGRIARRFDLSVVRQSEPDKDTPHSLIIESALFDSGRPVLVVPYVQKSGGTFDRVMVCWDGSRSAARAVGDAIPLLERAKSIEIVIVGDRPKSKEMPGADIAQHLARYNAKVRVEEIVVSDLDAANAILSHAADSSADFMVMGGYGHSRLREFVLGGVTRTMLATMTIPTLMSH